MGKRQRKLAALAHRRELREAALETPAPTQPPELHRAAEVERLSHTVRALALEERVLRQRVHALQNALSGALQREAAKELRRGAVPSWLQVHLPPQVACTCGGSAAAQKPVQGSRPAVPVDLSTDLDSSGDAWSSLVEARSAAERAGWEAFSRGNDLESAAWRHAGAAQPRRDCPLEID